MTSGRDEARKRRGRGKAGEGPGDDDFGWLADLRHAREDPADFSAGGTQTGPPPRQPDRESSIDLPARPRPATRDSPVDLPARPVGRDSSVDLPARRGGREEPLDVPAGPRYTAGRPQSLADAPPMRQPPPAAPANAPRSPRPSPAPPAQTSPAPLSVTKPASPGHPNRAGSGSTGPNTGGFPPVTANPTGPAAPSSNAGRTTEMDRTGPPRRPSAPKGPGPRPGQAPRAPGPRTADAGSRAGGDLGPRTYLPPPGQSAARIGGMRGIDLDDTTVLPLGSALMRQLQLRQVSRLRTATFVLLILAVVGAPAAFFVIREFTRDPVFVELDNLDVPQWAAGKHTDGAIGSRWCIRECRSRSRTWESARGPEETNRAYVAALKRAGWVPWNIPDCQAEGVDGIETCWQRDEYVLDLWVRTAVCDVKGVRPTVNPSGKAPSTSTGQGASAPAQVSPTDICPAAIASIKVYNRISYQPGG